MRRALLALLALTSFPYAAQAADPSPVDDRIVMNLVAEDWVKTETARVVIDVEASVSGAMAGNARAEMMDAVNDVSKADWRLTNFSRSQDQTGMERWSASFEARLPENKLGGLADAAKKNSKAGMQLSVDTIDFSPTLAEVQAGYSSLREQLYKNAKDQLTTLTSALPDRGYRIALIDFTDGVDDNDGMEKAAAPRMMRVMAMAGGNGAADSSAAPMEKAQKIVQTAHVVFAAMPDKKPEQK